MYLQKVISNKNRKLKITYFFGRLENHCRKEVDPELLV
jgi:hypothetical protein